MLNETFHVLGTHHLYSVDASAASILWKQSSCFALFTCFLICPSVKESPDYSLWPSLSFPLSHPSACSSVFLSHPCWQKLQFYLCVSVSPLCVGVCTHRHHWWVNISANSGIKPLKYAPPALLLMLLAEAFLIFSVSTIFFFPMIHLSQSLHIEVNVCVCLLVCLLLGFSLCWHAAHVSIMWQNRCMILCPHLC